MQFSGSSAVPSIPFQGPTIIVSVNFPMSSLFTEMAGMLHFHVPNLGLVLRACSIWLSFNVKKYVIVKKAKSKKCKKARIRWIWILIDMEKVNKLPKTYDKK